LSSFSELKARLLKPTPLLIILLIAAVAAARLLNLTTLDTMTIFMYFIAIAASLNLIMGFTGYVSFGHCVFLGIGAYIYALMVYYVPWANALQKTGGLGIIAVALIAAVIAALVAAAVGLAVLRLRGAFFAIATIGLDFAVLYIVMGTVPFINPEQFYGAQVILPSRCLVSKTSTFTAMFITMALVLATNYLVRKSRFGMGLVAINEDEDAAEVMGVPTAKYKTLAFTLSAFFTALAGAVFYLNGGGVSPEAFDLAHTVDMIVMIVIGGLGTVSGPIVGGIVYYWLYDTLLVHYPGVNLIILGIIVGLIILFAPEGVVGILRRYEFKGVKLREVLE